MELQTTSIESMAMLPYAIVFMVGWDTGTAAGAIVVYRCLK
jgi:hypothetical protein